MLSIYLIYLDPNMGHSIALKPVNRQTGKVPSESQLALYHHPA